MRSTTNSSGLYWSRVQIATNGADLIILNVIDYLNLGHKDLVDPVFILLEYESEYKEFLLLTTQAELVPQ